LYYWGIFEPTGLAFVFMPGDQNPEVKLVYQTSVATKRKKTKQGFARVLINCKPQQIVVVRSKVNCPPTLFQLQRSREKASLQKNDSLCCDADKLCYNFSGFACSYFCPVFVLSFVLCITKNRILVPPERAAVGIAAAAVAAKTAL
jgi:hypothetical protein